MIGFPCHQIVGVQITFMRENNALCSPCMNRIRKHLTALLQRLGQGLNFIGQRVEFRRLFYVLHPVATLFEFGRQIWIKWLNQLNGSQSDMFPLGVECLPSFKILQSFKQWAHTQVTNRIAVFPESFSTSLNQLTLAGFICFDGSQVANDFIQAFGGLKEAMKGHDSREA